MTPKEQITFPVEFSNTEYADYWVTVIHKLPIAAHGDSCSEAERRADDLLRAFLGYKANKGELRQYLKALAIPCSPSKHAHSYKRTVSVPVG